MFPVDNLDSWRRIRELIDLMVEIGWKEWRPIANQLLDALANEGLDRSFRVGLSMSHIIFSTIDRHGLTDEPRVTLVIYPAEETVTISYSKTHSLFGPAIEIKKVSMSEAIAELKRMLRRLWEATKPVSEMPAALQNA